MTNHPDKQSSQPSMDEHNNPYQIRTFLPSLRRIALLSVHSSPLGKAGQKKVGGMNIMVRAIATALAGKGIKVDVFTREDDPDHVGRIVEPIDNVRLIYLPAGPPQDLDSNSIYTFVPEFTRALLNFAAENQLTYDLIYSHYWISGAVAIEAREAWQAPIVQMFHTLGHMKRRIADAASDEPPQTLIPPPPDVRVEVEDRIMARADRLIAATHAERVQMVMLYRADRRRIEIVSPGVDLNRFQPMAMDVAKDCLGIDHDKKLLVFAGRIEPLKAVDTIIYAMALIKKGTPEAIQDLLLHVVGGDPYDQSADNAEMVRLQQLVSRLELEDHVYFVGAKPQDQLYAYYNAAETVILPSDYESFGMVALEAMACGTPVIASEVGGLAFLVKDGVTGYHVPTRDPAELADRIYRIVTSDERRLQMARAAQALAQEYSWDAIADRLIQIFVETQLDMKPLKGI